MASRGYQKLAKIIFRNKVIILFCFGARWGGPRFIMGWWAGLAVGGAFFPDRDWLLGSHVISVSGSRRALVQG